MRILPPQTKDVSHILAIILILVGLGLALASILTEIVAAGLFLYRVTKRVAAAHEEAYAQEDISAGSCGETTQVRADTGGSQRRPFLITKMIPLSTLRHRPAQHRATAESRAQSGASARL